MATTKLRIVRPVDYSSFSLEKICSMVKEMSVAYDDVALEQICQFVRTIFSMFDSLQIRKLPKKHREHQATRITECL